MCVFITEDQQLPKKYGKLQKKTNAYKFTKCFQNYNSHILKSYSKIQYYIY